MRKVAFILNPISGRGRKKEILGYIEVMLKKYPGWEGNFYTTKGVGDASSAARKFAEEGYDVVVAIGGDGTVNEVAKGVVGTSCRLAIVPVGSGNGLARHLGIPMSYQEAVQTVFDGKPQLIDAGRINDEYFFCTAGVGFDAAVGKRFNSSTTRGLVSYMEHCAKEYVKYEPEEYEIDILGTKFKQKAFLITFANSSQWGNNVCIAPDANISDGMMDVVIWRSSPMVTMPLITAELFLKKIKYSEFVDTYRCKEVVIRRKGSGIIQFDGESMDIKYYSITALNKGMINFKGVMLFSTNDHEIMQTVANRIIDIDTGFDKYCTYDEYAGKRNGISSVGAFPPRCASDPRW
mgnify:CR=1 FL=1